MTTVFEACTHIYTPYVCTPHHTGPWHLSWPPRSSTSTPATTCSPAAGGFVFFLCVGTGSISYLRPTKKVPQWREKEAEKSVARGGQVHQTALGLHACMYTCLGKEHVRMIQHIPKLLPEGTRIFRRGLQILQSFEQLRTSLGSY